MNTTQELNEVFASRIVEIREENGWSQAELAREMDTTSGFVCDYERGRRPNPTLRVVQRFADALGVQASELLK